MPIDADGTRPILRLLARGGEWTRQQLAEHTGWARNTVTQRVDALDRAGWVRQEDRISGRGRPSSVISLDPRARLIFVASFGLTHVTCALTDLFGDTITSRTVDVTIDVGPDRALGGVQRALQVMLSAVGADARQVGIVVVGLPSPIDQRTDRAINPSSMPGWASTSVTELFSERLGLPVLVENDANLLALGARARHPSNTDDLLFVKVAVGIGAGAIAGGQLIRGAKGLAGEIGHLPIERGRDQRCSCGNDGCVAMFAGSLAILESLREHDPSVETLDDVERLADNGDPRCLAALRQAGRDVGEVLVPAVAVLSPEVLVIGGRLVSLGDQFVSGLRETLYAKSQPALTADLRIEVSTGYDDISLRGAAALALDALLSG